MSRRPCLAGAGLDVQLAPGYQQAAAGGIGQGTLFLVEAGAASLGSGVCAAQRIPEAASYVEVPALGPLPSMYEPVWYAAKVVTAVAEAAAGALAVAGYALLHKGRHGSQAAAREHHSGASTA